MTTQQITKGLKEIGACWHRSAKKWDGRYEVLPDASYPHQSTLERFSSLRKIEMWIKARKQALKAMEDGDEAKARDIMEYYYQQR